MLTSNFYFELIYKVHRLCVRVCPVVVERRERSLKWGGGGIQEAAEEVTGSFGYGSGYQDKATE